MQTNGHKKVALTNSRKCTRKNHVKRKDRQSPVYLPFITFGQEMQQLYSFNLRDRTGLLDNNVIDQLVTWAQRTFEMVMH